MSLTKLILILSCVAASLTLMGQNKPQQFDPATDALFYDPLKAVYVVADINGNYQEAQMDTVSCLGDDLIIYYKNINTGAIYITERLYGMCADAGNIFLSGNSLTHISSTGDMVSVDLGTVQPTVQVDSFALEGDTLILSIENDAMDPLKVDFSGLPIYTSNIQRADTSSSFYDTSTPVIIMSDSLGNYAEVQYDSSYCSGTDLVVLYNKLSDGTFHTSTMYQNGCSDANIYIQDGSLTSDRVLDLNAFDFTFDGPTTNDVYISSSGDVGLGNSSPTEKLDVTGNTTISGTISSGLGLSTSGDIEINDIGEGVIIKSPDGTRWRLTVNNSGALITTSLP